MYMGFQIQDELGFDIPELRQARTKFCEPKSHR